MRDPAVIPNRVASYKGLDYYPTPYWATRALIPFLGDISDKTCIEPAAGGGHMVDILDQYFKEVRAVDIVDPENRGYEKHDFLTLDKPDSPYDWLITNPPFKLITEFIVRYPEYAKNCAILARLSLLESKGRYNKIWKQYPNVEVAVFVKRLMMVEGRLAVDGDGGSALCFAWFIWREDAKSSKISWISN